MSLHIHFADFFVPLNHMTCFLTVAGGSLPPYEIAYHNVVPSDPTMEDMKKKVVDEGVRPPLDPSWKNNEVSMMSYVHTTGVGNPLNYGLAYN